AWRKARGGGPVSGRLGRPEGRVPRSRSWRNRGTSAASPPRVKSGGFLWRRIPCEEGSNFIMLRHVKALASDGFLSQNRLVWRARAVIKWARVRTPKTRGSDGHEPALIDCRGRGCAGRVCDS